MRSMKRDPTGKVAKENEYTIHNIRYKIVKYPSLKIEFTLIK